MFNGQATSASLHDDESALPTRRQAWFVFTVLVLLMVMDYVDRQVVVSMFPHLRAEWGLSDRQLGGLVSIVSVVVALATVPLSLLADRWSRVKSIVIMAVLWSLESKSPDDGSPICSAATRKKWPSRGMRQKRTRS